MSGIDDVRKFTASTTAREPPKIGPRRPMPPRCAQAGLRGLRADTRGLPSRPPKALKERAKKNRRRPPKRSKEPRVAERLLQDADA
eukprot:1994401-Pyramimonas_sp.AAC.1